MFNIKVGEGKKAFFVVAEVAHMGMYSINIKITDNEQWANQNTILGKIEADTEKEARATFYVVDLTLDSRRL